MRYLLLGFLLAGCSVKGVNSTIFLKEDGSRLYNLNGKDCLESGYQVLKGPDGQNYRIITFYSNCEVHRERSLEEFELKTWGVEK